MSAPQSNGLIPILEVIDFHHNFKEVVS